jgi:hypothetical protein
MGSTYGLRRNVRGFDYSHLDLFTVVEAVGEALSTFRWGGPTNWKETSLLHRTHKVQ